MSCVPICRCCYRIARGSFFFFFLGYECLIDRLVCSSRKSLAEEESCHPESSDSCTGLHAECLLGGEGKGHASGNEKVFLPVFFLEEDSGIFISPGYALVLTWQKQLEFTGALLFFLPTDLPVTIKPPQCRDFSPGSGGNSAFHTAAATSPAGSLPKQCLPAAYWCWVGAAGSPLLLLRPSSETRASSAASSLPPAWHPPRPLLEIQYISILKHYATSYVCVAGKKLLSDTHWCY